MAAQDAGDEVAGCWVGGDAAEGGPGMPLRALRLLGVMTVT